jgi:hypothetical protein
MILRTPRYAWISSCNRPASSESGLRSPSGFTSMLMPIEEITQDRSEKRHALTGEPGVEPAAGIVTGKFSAGKGCDRATPARSAGERTVVDHNGDKVAGEADIEFDEVCTGVSSRMKGRHRVLRCMAGSSPMCSHQHHRFNALSLLRMFRLTASTVSLPSTVMTTPSFS